MKRYKVDSFVRVRSQGKMIKTAPSDILRPALGGSAIQPHAWREVQPTGRPVDNSPLKFHKAARHQLAVITALGLCFAGPPYGATRRCAAKNRSGDPICQEEFANYLARSVMAMTFGGSMSLPQSCCVGLTRLPLTIWRSRGPWPGGPSPATRFGTERRL